MLVPAPASAQQSGAFLRQEAGARAAALGGALTASEDAGALHGNPASLARLVKPEIGATHVTLFEDTSFDFVGAGAPLRRWGGFAAGYTRQSSGGFERRAGPNDAPVGFTISQSAVAGGWGLGIAAPDSLKALTSGVDKPLELGLILRSVREQIDTVSASGTGLDFGVILRPRPWAQAGLSVHNMIAPKLTFTTTPIPYPRVIDFTPSLRLKRSSEWTALIGLRLRNVENEGLSPSGGVELQYRRLAALRVGYGEKGMTAGTGIRIGNSQFDYAALLHDLGVSHIVSFTQRFGQTREELEETIRRGIQQLSSADGLRLSKAYLQKAEAELKDDRISEALRALEAASLLDPGNKDIPARINKISERWDRTIRRQMAERTAALAREQLEAGNLLTSRQYWRSVLDIEPGNSEATREIAAIDEALSSEERRRVEGLRLAQSANEIAQALAVAASHLARGQLRSAKLEAEKMLKRFPGNEQISGFLVQVEAQLAMSSKAKLEEAERAAESKEYNEALRLVDSALREDPSNAKLAEWAAQLRVSIQRTLTPESRKQVEQMYYRAVEQYLKGNYTAADELAKEVIRLDPGSESARALKQKVEAALRYSR